MRLPPLEVILSWPPPNYENPVTRGPALLIVNAIFIGLAVITVGLRLYTRIWIKRWFGIDDVFIILALMFTVGLGAVVILANQHYGWNRHIWDIPYDLYEPTLKIAMSAKVMFVVAASFTRLSLLCFYYRIVADSGRTWFNWLIHANVAYSVAYLVALPWVAIFLCIPASNYWKIGAPADSCLDEGVATLIAGVLNCIADLATTVTPLPLVMRLKLPRRQKIAVSMLFSLGIIVTIAGVVRTYYIYRSLFNEYDTTWYSYPLWIAAAVEIDLGVICASAPVLRPLLAKIPISLSETFSRPFSTKKGSASSQSKSLATNTNTALRTIGGGGASQASSKRKSDALSNFPELDNDHGRSYEMNKWDDVERDAERGTPGDGDSEDLILQNAEPETSSKGLRGMLGKVIPKDERSRTRDDMTITQTSEFKVQVSNRASRDPRS